MSPREVITVALLGAAALLAILAAIGVIRFPDVLCRMHAVTKAGSLGVAFAMAAAVVFFASDAPVWTRAVLVVLFTLATSPAAAHMIGRAAYLSRVPLAEATEIDELAEQGAPVEALLESAPPDAPPGGGDGC